MVYFPEYIINLIEMSGRLITLFSETDKYGTIIFVNDDFCDVSKYTKEELIGRPHNSIRHPEMPSRLFEILWYTIERSQVFRGIIKNRAKDHTHFWVRSIIMPVLDGKNEIHKYISVGQLIGDDRKASELYIEQAQILSL